MRATIAGHTLTKSELAVLDAILDYLRLHGGDSHMGPNTSPKGDGQWVRLCEIFPERRGRRTSLAAVGRLHGLGVLAACEVAYYGGCAKAVPYRRVRHVEDEQEPKPAWRPPFPS